MPACQLIESSTRPLLATCAPAGYERRSRDSCLRWAPGLLMALTLIACACAEGQSAAAQSARNRNHRSRVYGVGGYGNRGPGTAQSAAQFGMARMITATGNANLMNSAAAKNLTAAKSADIANRVQWTNSYYLMRQTHKEYAAANITRLSTDELNKIAQDEAAKRLDVTQLDSTTGVIHWPIILQDKQFIADRDDLDRLFKIRAMATGPIDVESYQDIHRTCERLQEQLKANIDHYRGSDFEHARHFVESLAHEGTLPNG